MIRGFKDEGTAAIWKRERPRKLAPIAQLALRKLRMLDAAARLDDLLIPPGNRLEKLRGDRTGQHSIRINDRFRVCFVWKDGDAYEVEIVDYH